MKDEIDISSCETVHEIYEVLLTWTEYYNTERYQWDMARLSPREYYDYLMTGKYPLAIPTPKTIDAFPLPF